jgi:hypothetical protein
MKKIVLAVSVATLSSTGAYADVSDSEWTEFKKDYAALVERVNVLSAENAKLKSATAGLAIVSVEDLEATNAEMAELREQAKSTSWAENVRWQGDYRLRWEEIDDDSKDEERTRARIRARAALIANLPRGVEVGLGIATGGDDPVSTNQTLGGGGSTKDVRLDLAYFRWKPNNWYLGGGKFKNPHYRSFKSQLIWDGDFRPEGIFGGYQGEHFFLVGQYSWIESDSSKDDDELWSLQGGTSWGPLNASLGYLYIPTEGRTAAFDSQDCFGNSCSEIPGADGDLKYLYNYEVINASIDTAFELGDLPLGLYFDFIQNQDADDLDTGYIAGIKLGKAKKPGTWQLQYQYEDLEADATLGLITDSDFMGGGTDGKGHKLGAAYAIHDKWSLALTYFDGTKGMDLGKDVDYKRLMIDTKFKY